MGKEEKELLLCAEVEVEAPVLVKEAMCGGVVDADAEEQVEEHDEERERDLAVEGNEIAVGVGG